MAFTTAAISDILKIDYQGPVREQLNNSTVLYKQLKKNTEDFIGSTARIPLHTGRNVGLGSRIESDSKGLPTAGNQQYSAALYDVKLLYGAIELSGLAKERSKNNTGSFVRALDSEMKGLMTDLKCDINRQLWHDGSSSLTQMNDAATTAAFTVQSTKFLKVGQRVQIFSSAGTEKTSGAVTIATITSATAGTLSTTTSVRTATDIMILYGSRQSGTWGVHQELWGLEALISDANPGTSSGITDLVGTLTRTGTVQWDANVLDNSGTNRDLTLDLLQQAYDVTEIESDEVPGLILANHAIKRRYAALLVADKRYPPGGDITLDGGYKALEFNGTPLVADKDASLSLGTNNSLNRIYFLTMSSLEMQVLRDWGWLDEDGSVLKMKPATESYADAWQAYMGAYLEMGIVRPNANCVLKDITETA
jgi:hypothetical protein